MKPAVSNRINSNGGEKGMRDCVLQRKVAFSILCCHAATVLVSWHFLGVHGRYIASATVPDERFLIVSVVFALPSFFLFPIVDTAVLILALHSRAYGIGQIACADLIVCLFGCWALSYAAT